MVYGLETKKNYDMKEKKYTNLITLYIFTKIYETFFSVKIKRT